MSAQSPGCSGALLDGCHWIGEGAERASVMPYVAHPVRPDVARAIAAIGAERDIPAGCYVVPPEAPIDKVVLVLSGVIARQAGRKDGPIGISPAGRFACGHLNFFTRQPAIGSYWAITDSRAVIAGQDELRGLLRADAGLLMSFARQCELCTLSDRYGLATLSQLEVRERICMLLIALARTFGRFARKHEQDAGWFIVPELPAEAFCRIVNTSPAYLERVLRPWIDKGFAAVRGGEVAVHASLLFGAFDWMEKQRGPASLDLPSLFLEVVFSIPRDERAPGWLP
ncbi:MAG: Crp/Fnr family transcriptional regulator [Duodenibacillus sp.]|nr:Crp/Fnr family transcriptional regulator [Duodenibacillus sp.]